MRFLPRQTSPSSAPNQPDRHFRDFVFTRAATTTGGPHHLCSKPSSQLLWRPAHPKAIPLTASFCYFWCFLVHTLSISIFCYSPTLHLCDFHVWYSRTPPFYWERTVSVCIMSLYSVFLLCVFPPPLSFYSSCILFFLCIHACTPMCYILPRHPFAGLHIGGPYMFGGTYFVWRAISSEGSMLGGLFLCFFCVSLSFLSPWLDQLSFHYQMVYAIYLEIIIHIPCSIFHTLCYMW